MQRTAITEKAQSSGIMSATELQKTIITSLYTAIGLSL
jgi:hypothetical protein